MTTGSSGADELNGGTVIAQDDETLRIDGNVDASSATAYTIDDGATLAFDGAVGSGGNDTTVTFGPAFTTTTLDLTGEGQNYSATTGAEFQAKIDDFSANDQILLAAGNFSTPDFVVYDKDTGLLKVENTNPTDNVTTIVDEVTLDPPSPIYYSFGTENGAPDVIINTTGGVGSQPAFCFYAGTRIRTCDGEVLVETLKTGDLVLTHDGRSVPVSWLGKQTISMKFADPMRVLPIRIKAGALAENTPTRDLLISPDHAVLIGGALVQAGALVNETSIVRERRVPMTFIYYHVETDDHSLILAEGAPDGNLCRYRRSSEFRQLGRTRGPLSQWQDG